MEIAKTFKGKKKRKPVTVSGLHASGRKIVFRGDFEDQKYTIRQPLRVGLKWRGGRSVSKKENRDRNNGWKKFRRERW